DRHGLQKGQGVSRISSLGSSYTVPTLVPGRPLPSASFKCQRTVTVCVPTSVTTPCSDGGFVFFVTDEPTDSYIFERPFSGNCTTRFSCNALGRHGLRGVCAFRGMCTFPRRSSASSPESCRHHPTNSYSRSASGTIASANWFLQ